MAAKKIATADLGLCNQRIPRFAATNFVTAFSTSVLFQSTRQQGARLRPLTRLGPDFLFARIDDRVLG